MEWKTVKISDIAYIINGGTPKTSIPEYWDGDIPWLSVKDFNTGLKYVSSAEKHITEEGLEHSATNLLEPEDIIISARGTVGVIAMLSRPMAFNQSCFGLRARNFDAHYLYYLLKEKVKELQGQSQGSVFDTIVRATFDRIECVIPDTMDDQRRIAAILSSLDDKIENNNRINRNLEAQAQALFKSWFVDFEPWGGIMPEDWKEGTLGEICKIKYGKGLSTNLLTDEGYPVFGGNGVIGYYSKFLYELPQILVSCRGAASGKIMESDPHSFVTSNSLVLEMNDRAYYYYLKYLLLANPLYNYATGSAQPQITIDNIKDVDIVLPSIDIVNTISEKFEVIDEQIRSLRRENDRLAALRDTLLPKLMKGEITL